MVFTTATSLQVLPDQYCSFLNSHLYQKSQVVPWTFRKYNQSELHTMHQVLLNMIRVKEQRALVGILNYADGIFSQCFFYSMLQCFLSQRIDMLGTHQVANIIKELWTEFDESIAFLCKGEHWITPRGNVKSYQSYRKGMHFLFHFILFHGSGNGINSISLLASPASLMEFNFSPPSPPFPLLLPTAPLLLPSLYPTNHHIGGQGQSRSHRNIFELHTAIDPDMDGCIPKEFDPTFQFKNIAFTYPDQVHFLPIVEVSLF